MRSNWIKIVNENGDDVCKSAILGIIRANQGYPNDQLCKQGEITLTKK